MKNFHLIGQSIQTSLSPLIHNYLFQLKNLPLHQYSIYPKDNHLLTLTDLDKENIHGISITIPFKLSYKSQIQTGVLGNCFKVGKSLSKKQQQLYRMTAQRILQKRFIINTIRKNTHINNVSKQSPHFTCFNTDIFGIKQCITKNKQFSDFSKQFLSCNSEQSSTRAVIIGGGATAETFMSYFEQRSIPMIVINRSIDKIVNLKANSYYSHIQSVASFNDKDLLDENILSNIGNLVVINTLPTNILRQNIYKQQNNPFKQLLNSINLNNIFYMDVNYRDDEQSLLHAITRCKNKTKSICRLSTGLDMLVWQGILQNYLFCEEDNVNYTTTMQSQYFDQQFMKLMAKLKQQGKA